jgi:hypothetical protein
LKIKVSKNVSKNNLSFHFINMQTAQPVCQEQKQIINKTGFKLVSRWQNRTVFVNNTFTARGWQKQYNILNKYYNVFGIKKFYSKKIENFFVLHRLEKMLRQIDKNCLD